MPDISEETITCHSPAMGKDTAKKSPVDIPAWKFNACRHAILAVLDEGETIGWDALSRSADARLTPRGTRRYGRGWLAHDDGETGNAGSRGNPPQ